MRLLSGLLLIVLLLVGCGSDERTMQLIGEAESVMIEHPDSALNIMCSIDPETIRGEEDVAHYRLAMAEAMYYNDVDEGCDSLTSLFYDYYLTSDDHAKRARALYQHAIVMMYNGERAKAMYSLLEAEKSFVNITGDRLIGNAYLLKGEIYVLECLFDNALESYYIALNHFKHDTLGYHIAYTHYRIGEALSIKEDYVTSATHLRLALEASLEGSYQGVASLVINQLSQMYVRVEEYSECRDIIDLYDQYNIPIECQDAYYYVRAILESGQGNRDKAIQYVELADNYEGIDVLEEEYYKYIVYRNLGDADEALYWLEQDRLQQQQLILESLELPILNMQVEALVRESELAEVYRRNVRLSYIIICVVAVVLIAVVGYYIIRKRKQHQFEVAQYIEAVRELQMVDRSVNVTMSDQIYSIYKTRFTELNSLCDIYYDHNDSDRQKSMVFRQLQDTIESLKSDSARIEEMERVVNLYCNNIMAKLTEECPRLSERQRRIALYTFAGFSLRAIALFMNSNPVQISKDKYKIKDVIKRGNAPSSELFIANL